MQKYRNKGVGIVTVFEKDGTPHTLKAHEEIELESILPGCLAQVELIKQPGGKRK